MRPCPTVCVSVLSFVLAASLAPAQTMTATGSFTVSVGAGGVSDMRSGPFPGPVTASASSGNLWVSGTGSGSLQGLSGFVTITSNGVRIALP